MCIPTDQGTGTPETCLCSKCFESRENISYARNCAYTTDDIDPVGEFVDCSGNNTLECCICGKRIDGSDQDLLSFQDIIDDIASALEMADGEYVTKIHNEICSDNIVYKEDSMWSRT